MHPAFFKAFSASMVAPSEAFRTSYQLWMLGLEAQSVIALRMLGMTGIWTTSPGEKSRMVAEKPPAFARSAQSMFTAAAKGKRPDQIVGAGVKPLRRKTRANVKRLAAKGPKTS